MKSQASEKNLAILKCECGAEILLIPDLEAMNLAIENHIAEHKKHNSIEEEKGNQIRDILIAQLFEKASIEQ